jgi:hypothetical protein
MCTITETPVSIGIGARAEFALAADICDVSYY